MGQQQRRSQSCSPSRNGASPSVQGFFRHQKDASPQRQPLLTQEAGAEAEAHVYVHAPDCLNFQNISNRG